jgi:NTE family protein
MDDRGRAGAAGGGRELAARRVGVCLSSGYFGFFAHHGFMRALRRLGVEPVAISGCSAGALVGALWASGLDEDQIRQALLSVSIRDLVDPPAPADLAPRPFGLARGARLERRLRDVLPVQTFAECPVPLSVTVFDLDEGRLRAIEDGDLPLAIRASASLPGMFSPTRIDGHWCWDGGVVDKAPVAPLAARGDLDLIVISYLPRRRRGPARTLFAGLRAALDSHIMAAAQRAVEQARGRGIEVLVVAPRVPRCGPLRLGQGSRIMLAAEAETSRIFGAGAFGSEELV